MGCSIDWPLTFQGVKTLLDPIASASWPIATAWVVWFFRADLTQMLTRLRTIKGAGVEAEWSIETQQGSALIAAESSVAITANLGSGLPLPDDVFSTMDQQLRDLLEKEIPNDPSRQLAWAIRMRSISEANKLHEAHYRIIFGSQIRALRALNNAGPSPANAFEPFFNEARDNPETAAFHEGRTFEQWGQFLVGAGYVQAVEGTDPVKVEITPLGRQFLMWLRAARVSDVRPG